MPPTPMFTHPRARLVLSHPIVHPRVNALLAFDDLGYGLPESERDPDVDSLIDVTGAFALYCADVGTGGLFLEVAGTRLPLGEKGVRAFVGLGMGSAGDKGGSVWFKLGEEDVWTLWLEGATASNLNTLRDLISGLPQRPIDDFSTIRRTGGSLRAYDLTLRNSVVVVDELNASVIRVLKQGVILSDARSHAGLPPHDRALDTYAACAASGLGGTSRAPDAREPSSTETLDSLDTLRRVSGSSFVTAETSPHHGRSRSRSRRREGSSGSTTTRARSRSSEGTFLTVPEGGSVASRRTGRSLSGSDLGDFAAAIDALDGLSIADAAAGDSRLADEPAQGHNTASGVLLSFLAGGDVTASTISPHAPKSTYVPASASDLWSLLTWFTSAPIDLLRSSASWLGEVGSDVLAWAGIGSSFSEPLFATHNAFPSEDDYDYAAPAYDPASLADPPRPVARRKPDSAGGSRFSVYHYDAGGYARPAYFGRGGEFRGAA